MRGIGPKTPSRRPTNDLTDIKQEGLINSCMTGRIETHSSEMSTVLSDHDIENSKRG